MQHIGQRVRILMVGFGENLLDQSWDRKERDLFSEECRDRDFVGRIVNGWRDATDPHRLVRETQHRETGLVDGAEVQRERPMHVQRTAGAY